MGSPALVLLFAVLAFDGLRSGSAWSRTGRDTSRRQQPIAYWFSIGGQLGMAALCVWCSFVAWDQPA